MSNLEEYLDSFSAQQNVPKVVALNPDDFERELAIINGNVDYTNLRASQSQESAEPVLKETDTHRGQHKQRNNNKDDWETNPHYVRLKKLIGCAATLQLIAHAYNKQGGYLTEKSRKILIHKFIDLKKKELVKEFKEAPLDDWNIDVLEFSNFATTIEKVFPSENAATYFTPFKIENGVRMPSTGKVKHHFDYVKGQLRKEGVIKPYVKKTAENPSESRLCVFEETIENKIKYLEVHSDDVDKIKQYWSETYEARMRILEFQQLSVHDYCHKFKGLKEQLGFDLIELDFQCLYPEKVNNLLINWVLIKDHLIKILKTITLQSEAKKLFDLISTLSPENRDAVLFYLLIYMVPTVQVNKSQKRKRVTAAENQDSENVVPETNEEKKTLNEKRESYMLVIPIPNEEDPTLDRLKVTLLSKKLTLQPLFVIVGSLLNIRKVYVVIDDTWFECDSVLQAVTFTFKSFFALHCAYPVETYNVWNFIQRAFFEIKLQGEKVSIKTKTLEKQIENLLKEHRTT